MKVRILSALLLFVFVLGQSSQVFAGVKVGEIINADKSNELLDEAYNDLQQLEQLEQELMANPNLSLEDINLDAYNLDYTDYETSFASVMGVQEAPLGIPSFFWGFCLGWVGLLIVFLMNDDSPDKKEEMKKALIGCGVATAIWVVVYVVIIAAAANEANNI